MIAEHKVQCVFGLVPSRRVPCATTHLDQCRRKPRHCWTELGLDRVVHMSVFNLYKRAERARATAHLSSMHLVGSHCKELRACTVCTLRSAIPVCMHDDP